MNETPRYVLDSSVATKWHLKDEEHVDIALRVMNDSIHGKIRLFGPLQLQYEAAAALLNATRPQAGVNRITIDAANESISDFLALPIQYVDHPSLVTAALTVGNYYGSSYYDSLYVALAQMMNVPLLHADNKLRGALKGRFVLERWIEDY